MNGSTRGSALLSTNVKMVTRSICCILAWLLLPSLPALGQPSFKVIVHASNPQTTIDRTTLGKFFLKKIKRWDDGIEVVPINLLADAEVRESFSQEIHKKSSWAIRNYWERMIFSGRDLPPAEVATDEEAIAAVVSNRGAVAYVSRETRLPPGVKVLALRD